MYNSKWSSSVYSSCWKVISITQPQQRTLSVTTDGPMAVMMTWNNSYYTCTIPQGIIEIVRSWLVSTSVTRFTVKVVIHKWTIWSRGSEHMAWAVIKSSLNPDECVHEAYYKWLILHIPGICRWTSLLITSNFTTEILVTNSIRREWHWRTTIPIC